MVVQWYRIEQGRFDKSTLVSHIPDASMSVFWEHPIYAKFIRRCSQENAVAQNCHAVVEVFI